MQRHQRITKLFILATLAIILTAGHGLAGDDNVNCGVSDSVYSAGCFITASLTEFGGISLLFGLCILTTLYGLRLVVRSTATKNDMK